MRRSGLALVLLALLIVADIVLVTGALRSTHVDTSKYARAQADAAGTHSAPAAGTAQTPSTDAQTHAGRVIVAGLTKTRAWRAVTHAVACRAGTPQATIAHTDDSGKHWISVKVPMTTVSGLSYADGVIVATGLDRSCQPTTYALTSRSAPRKTAATTGWVVDASDPAKLQVSGGPVAKQPCADGLLDVATNSASDVVALCANGSVQHTTDTGATWAQLMGKSGAVSIATGSSAVYVASRSACGISVRSVGADAGGCIDGTQDWSGPIDITVVGDTLWLVSGTVAITQPVNQLR